MVYLAYFILAALVVWFSIQLSYYVDLLDKTTKISGALLGGVMLAAVTSLPELFTSLSAVAFVKQPDMVMGNILGSNLFNVAVLGLLILMFFKKFKSSFINKSHLHTVFFVVGIYVMIVIPALTNQPVHILGISLFSILIILFYIFAIRNMAADGEKDKESAVQSRLTTKQILLRFSLLSIGLIVSSIFITIVTNMIEEKLHIGVTLAGALFLGIATSLPEVVSSFSLVRLGNYNAAVGNIIGSNLFNFCIIALCDVFYQGQSLYMANKQTYLLLFFGLFSTICIGILLAYKLYRKSISYKILNPVYIGTSALALGGYIAFLFLS